MGLHKKIVIAQKSLLGKNNLQNKMLFTCQIGYIARNPSNIHKVNNVIVGHLTLSGVKGFKRHLKRHMVMLNMLYLTTK